MGTEKKVFTTTVSQLDAKILGLTLGILFGLIIFIATNWLVIKGGPEAGIHLRLLSQFFIGYKVSFPGSVIGLIYGFITGTIFGVLVGWVYNGLLYLTKK